MNIRKSLARSLFSPQAVLHLVLILSNSTTIETTKQPISTPTCTTIGVSSVGWQGASVNPSNNKHTAAIKSMAYSHFLWRRSRTVNTDLSQGGWGGSKSAPSCKNFLFNNQYWIISNLKIDSCFFVVQHLLFTNNYRLVNSFSSCTCVTTELWPSTSSFVWYTRTFNKGQRLLLTLTILSSTVVKIHLFVCYCCCRIMVVW